MIYLDNAATSFPKPESVITSMTKCMKEYCANPGRSGHKMAVKMGTMIYEARERLAAFFGISNPLQIIFTSNATESLNLAIKGLLKPGDHVITTAMEHNSVLRPLKEMRGITTTIIPADKEGFIHAQTVENAIIPATKLIIVTHSSNVTGTIMPIERIGQICRKRKKLFMVDASQSAGILPIDVNKNNIDILACPGHKSLFGPQGTGFLYVRDGITLKPLKCGGTGTDSLSLTQPQYFPEGYESGTLNGPGIIGLNEGLRFIEKIGRQTIHQWENSICSLLYDELSNIPGMIIYGPKKASEKTAIVTFNIKNKDCENVAEELNHHYNIAVRAGFHCAPLAHKAIGTYNSGAVRISPGLFTTKSDIYKAVDAIYRLSF